jgi:hypothetical protein
VAHPDVASEQAYLDHVYEPAGIVDEPLGGQGLREPYVALTRPTRTLVVVHARPLPAELQAFPEMTCRAQSGGNRAARKKTALWAP